MPKYLRVITIITWVTIYIFSKLLSKSLKTTLDQEKKTSSVKKIINKPISPEDYETVYKKFKLSWVFLKYKLLWKST